MEGVRVLDLSRVVAAPMATMLLGDLGARVIKLERPGSGDETRAWGPPFAGGESAYYLALNRQKYGIAVDLARPLGRQVLERLVDGWADVVVENFRGRALARLGLSRDAILQRRPTLIWATVTGYGPEDARPGYDFIMQGLSGFMSLNGPADGGPYRAPVAVSDLVTGLHLAVGIVSALYRRAATGVGGTVETSLFEAQLASLPNVTEAVLTSGAHPRRHGNAHPQLAPYEVVEAKDQAFTLGVGNDAQFRRLAAVVGLPALADDVRFHTNAARVRHRAELMACLGPVLRERSAADWVARLTAADIPAGRIQSVPEALASEETRRTGMLETVEHPTVGTLAMVGHPVRFDGHRPAVTLPPPLLGQHTVEVLHEIGYDEASVATLLADGAVARWEPLDGERGGGRL